MKTLKLYKFFIIMLIVVLICTTIGCNETDRKQDIQWVSIVLSADMDENVFNECFYQEIKKDCEINGVKINITKTENKEDYIKKHRAQAKHNMYSLIIAASPDQAQAVDTVSKEYPNQKFTLLGALSESDNTKSIIFRDNEIAFISGVYAGLFTETNKISIINSNKNSYTESLTAGYIAGAKMVNDDIDVLFEYIDDTINSENIYNLANNMYVNGVDIIYQTAGENGEIISNAAHDNGKYTIENENNRNSTMPNNIIMSTQKKLDSIFSIQLHELLQGKWKSGITEYGIKENTIECSFVNSNIIMPKEYTIVANELSDMISNGTIIIPIEVDSVEQFILDNKY